MSDNEVTTSFEDRATRLLRELQGGSSAGDNFEAEVVKVLRDVAREERERCAAVASERAKMWERSLKRAAGAWPREGEVEARARRNEALALADCLLGPEESSSSDRHLRPV